MRDANGINFQLLLGPEDWGAALTSAPGSDDVVWDSEHSAVMLRPEIRRFPPRSGAATLSPDDRRGADADCFGNWYWIDADARSIRTWRPGQTATTFWSADLLDAAPCPPTDGSFADHPPSEPAFASLQLSGLTVTTRHFLVVGTHTPNGYLAFDLHGAGPPILQVWDSDTDIAIFDMSPGSEGTTWLLDRGLPAGPAVLWQMDHRFCLTSFAGDRTLPAPPPAIFFDKDAGPQPQEAETLPIGLDLSTPSGDGTPGATNAIAVAGLPDATALVLDAPDGQASRLLRFGPDGLLSAVTLTADLLTAFENPPTALQGHDIAFLANPNAAAGRIEGAVFLVDAQGDQALRFDLRSDMYLAEGTADLALNVTLNADYIPLRRFGGRALVAYESTIFYDLDESWQALARHPRRRRQSTGRFNSGVFDSGAPGTAWHRCLLDGCIPPGTTVSIGIRAADDRDALVAMPFDVLPTPYQRGDGAEVPFWSPYPDADPARATGTWETLVQAARGRFMELQITLSGDGTITPRLRALRVYAPRFSYLNRYLPAAYREDKVSAAFLDRFLANVEGLFTTKENRVAAAHGLWDTRVAPAQALDWLAGWLGAELEPDWDPARKRLFIAHAELLFRWRGTPAGLKALIDIATDPCPDETLFDGLKSGQPPEPDSARRGVRLSEDYARRSAQPGLTDPADLLLGWTPEDGAGPLHIAFEAFALERRETDIAGLAAIWGRPLSPGSVRFAPLQPALVAEREDWLAFTAGPIGFQYAAASLDSQPAWRSFMARRYATPDRIAAAHGLTGTHVSPTDLPTTMPDGGTYLKDWIDFVSGVLPNARAAHRFIVLAPVDPAEAVQTRDARIAAIARIVEKERPAHTAFEVRPYWALFQTGIARLGSDTALGEGARFTAIDLGRSALGQGFIGYGHPYAVTDRTVVGRNAAGEVRL